MKKALVLSVIATFLCASAFASLTHFQSFTGNVGYSADGFGSTSNTGTISAEVPVGSTVLAAYLYSSLFSGSTAGVDLNGSAASFTDIGGSSFQGVHRADVTNIIKPLIDSGPGGVYNFSITETVNGNGINGEALVVVYENASLSTATVGILDGFSSTSGDSTAINFTDPLDPSAPGFFAEMSLGIGHSCCTSQRSTVTVNGATLTTNAGNQDDGATANGALITVGGFDDPFSPVNPTYNDDHERYDLSSFVNQGDTSININTVNPSNDDNIFLATFYVSGLAGVNAPPPPPPAIPEPSTVFLSLIAFVAFAYKRKS